ncbi:hypothetical protein ABET51_07805 [Metabacillus fastidiosus]|uniref:hypothetical protein n=1 Tax=Metabacillus fastidiosus TaxID=1458 RepID=UPI002E221DE5|nr:YiiX/YebB-like N1pC/P60 family cysteine hydrolase [Metabacillus fastidiosus]
MNLKTLSAVLLSSTFLISPVTTKAQVESTDVVVQQEIQSKIDEIDNLLEIDSLLSKEKMVMRSSLDKKESKDNNEFKDKKESKKKKVNKDQFFDEVNNIHIEVENYFNAIDNEEFYNYESFNQLTDKLDKLDLVSKKYDNKNKERSSQAATWRYGDILYYGVGNRNAGGEKSITGHTAVLTKTEFFVVEAARTKNNGHKVHHWNRNNLWEGASGIKQYKVTSVLGKNATAAQREKAVKYGTDQKGEPYSIQTDIFSSKSWYCSKLTYKQWDHAGYDLRGARGLTVGGYLLVIPADITIDANTRLYKDWKTALPGKA